MHLLTITNFTCIYALLDGMISDVKASNPLTRDELVPRIRYSISTNGFVMADSEVTPKAFVWIELSQGLLSHNIEATVRCAKSRAGTDKVIEKLFKFAMEVAQSNGAKTFRMVDFIDDADDMRPLAAKLGFKETERQFQQNL